VRILSRHWDDETDCLGAAFWDVLVFELLRPAQTETLHEVATALSRVRLLRRRQHNAQASARDITEAVVVAVEVASGNEECAVGQITQADGDGREDRPPKCQSNDNQYKCGVFLENLIDEHPITWLGALPDALKKVSPSEYKEILGKDISPESFNNHTCDITAANSRCYATLAKFKGDPLDSCEKNLVNTKSTETVGDYLCNQVKRWLRNDADFKVNGRDNIKIPIYYSSCGGEWTHVTSGGAGLYVDEPLCCKPDGTFRRCDGSDYNLTC